MSEIQFKTKEFPTPRKVEFDFPADLEGLVGKYGAETVYGKAVANMTIDLQALCRRNIEKSDAEIQDIVSAWDPNTRAAPSKQTPTEKITSAWKGLSAEDRAELLARLQAGN